MPALPTWFTVGGGVGEQGTRGTDALSGSSLKPAGEFTSERQAIIPSSRRRDGNLVATRGDRGPTTCGVSAAKGPLPRDRASIVQRLDATPNGLWIMRRRWACTIQEPNGRWTPPEHGA